MRIFRNLMANGFARFLVIVLGISLITYFGSSAITGNRATAGYSSTPETNSSTNSSPASQGNAANQSSLNQNTLQGSNQIETVFLIVMENHNWSQIQNNPSASFINKTLLPEASQATHYYNPPGIHPSEPNYLWLEAGTSFGINNDNSPQSNHQNTTDHLVTLLDKAGISWKAYLEGISGSTCPLTGAGLYAPKHNPMVYFNDVTNNNDPNSTYCINHERPLSELQRDLQNTNVARYNFISANLCNDMHNSTGCATSDSVKNGDTWLSNVIPMIMASDAYKQGGVIFITWDEGTYGDGPIGMIVLSPLAKGHGYSNSIYYTHSSILRTIEEIFRVRPLLGDAANATDLRDLFTTFP